MIVRRNPALPPIIRGGPAEVHTHLLCRAIAEHVLAEAGADATRLCAAHLLDQSTTSELLGRCNALAEVAADAWARHLTDLPWARQTTLPRARIGTGRRNARDRGGRIASAVTELAESLTSGALATGERRAELDRAGRLWPLAHPLVAEAISRLRTFVGHARSLASDRAPAYTYCLPPLRSALAAVTIPCGPSGCGPVCTWDWCQPVPDILTENSITISFSCGERITVGIPHDGVEVASARAHRCVVHATVAPATATPVDADGAPLAEWERELLASTS